MLVEGKDTIENVKANKPLATLSRSERQRPSSMACAFPTCVHVQCSGSLSITIAPTGQARGIKLICSKYICMYYCSDPQAQTQEISSIGMRMRTRRTACFFIFRCRRVPAMSNIVHISYFLLAQT